MPMCKPGLNKKFLIFCLLFLVVLIMPAGCQNNKHELTVGVSWPIKSVNDDFLKGVLLAAEEINSNSEKDAIRIRLDTKDDEGTVTGGLTAAQSFVREGVAAVIGHRTSSVSIAASSIYEKAGIVMMSPTSTATNLTSKGYKFIFRDIPSDDESARQLALFAAKQGHRRMAIYYAENSYGLSLANSFEDHAKEAGIAIVDRISGYSDYKDLERISRKWKALDFDGVFLAQDAPEGAKFLGDRIKAGFDEPCIGGDGMDSPLLWEIGGAAAEGTVIGTVFNSQDSRKEVKQFISSFNRKYNRAPSTYAALGYDAVNLVAYAAQKAGTNTPTAIADSLRTLKDVPGVIGYHTFSSNGDDTGIKIVKKQVRDGKFVIVE